MRRYDLHQAEAREKSFRLFVCIFLMELITVTFAGIGVGYFFGLVGLLTNWEIVDTYDMTPVVLTSAAIVMPIVFIVMVGTGIFKFLDLRGGGIRIAEILNARHIAESTETLRERQLLNIVSELAISSGIPVPPVFVMDGEPGINALAAGHNPSNAVIVVTEGTLKRLGRDQIQGVMAHEFSHILNGDIRRNMLLMAISHGNFSIISLAQGLIESEPVLDDLDGNAFINMLFTAIGGILWPVGAFGACIAMFFTSLIKCQDEFKADATAVEMTRLPNGLAEALMMIGGNQRKASIRRSSAFATSHLFFADSGWSLHRIFDSHPPLEERIIRLDPNWDGCYMYESEDELGDYAEVYEGVTELVGLAKMTDDPAAVASTVGAVATAAGSNSVPVEEDKPETLEDAPEWMQLNSQYDVGLDPVFVELASDGQGAGLVLAAVHLDQFDQETADEIIGKLNPLISAKVRQIYAQVAGFTAGQKITMFDIALENLRSAPPIVRSALSEFANLSSDYFDDRTDMKKWAWHRLVTRRLNRSKPPKVRHPRLTDLCAETALLISAVIHTEPNVQAAGQYTFMRAMAHTDIEEIFKLIPQSECTIERIEHSLSELATVPARERRKLLVATGVCVTSDREITVPEAWILRVACEALNFPMPRLVPDQPIAAGI